MPLNKRHDILGDIWDYPFWNSQHVTRVGMVLNTLEMAKAVVLKEDFLSSLKEANVSVHTPALKDLVLDKPHLIQFQGHRDVGGPFIIAILCVYNKDTGELECYPFSNNNPDNKFWPYDLRFFITQPSSSFPSVRSGTFHPASAGEKISEEAELHMMALASLILGFFKRFAQGEFHLAENNEALDKLNKKRLKNDKPVMVKDWFVV